MEPVARDLIQRARRLVGKAHRSDECRALLAEAEQLVERGDEWIAIADVWAELGEHDAARRYIALGLASPRDHETFTDAAWILRRRLGDAEAARVILERCADYLRTTKRPDWLGLGRKYVELLGDRVTAREMFALAAADADAYTHTLIYLAEAYVRELDDRAAALALMMRAEAGAISSDLWSIANAYRDLFGDVTRAREIVDTALARAADLRDVVWVAHYAPSSKRDDAAELEGAAYAKAESLAVSADDWLYLTDQYYDRKPRELAQIRRCLQRALDADTDGAARPRIAHAYRHRANDHAMAAKLAPEGIAPADIVVQRHVLGGWRSEPARLLDWLRPQLDAKRMDGLSQRGGTDRDKNLAAIGDIQRTGLVLYPLEWHPREAFEWERWTRGADVDPIRRAFACTVLLIADAGPEWRDGFEASVAALVESCRELGEEALAGATGLLVALAESMDPDLPRFALALFGVLLAAAALDPADPRLPALCDRLITVVADYDDVFTRYTTEWLLGLTNFDSAHEQFRKLTAAILGADPSRAHLVKIATLVASTKP